MDNSLKLIPILNKIAEFQNPGKKTLQKLVYLIEKKGLYLGFDYSIHYYGPYSATLDHAVHRLEMQGALEIIPDGRSQRVHITDLSDSIIDEIEQLDYEQMKIVDEVLVRFANLSAADLEVVTTTDYVARELLKSGIELTDELIIDGVKTIKGDKFSRERILQAIYQLKENGYVA